ncbi:Immediate-early protein 2 [Streptomyces sp. NRRL F-4489]|uniref:SRPBCC family protein n=1 Tax=Streptomyces sp. NRRL F-4489 TaxID=1609095 RepID=UPI00074626E8|nr:SRPBCC family protein [Streptomyces sp. NRRL F-4489]KUL46109.1 Immediate-early protein 2 [Streptomyces sp. NRRL F-4489]
MTEFRIVRTARCSPEAAWQRLTRWEAHAAHVPLTTITVTTPPPTGPGTTFVARTALGPLAFDDVMRVVRWEPPARSGSGAAASGRCRLEKRGRAVRGWSEIEVGPHAAGGCRIVWRGEIHPRGLPAALQPLTARPAGLLYARILRGLVAG